jgi:hypothetical protein
MFNMLQWNKKWNIFLYFFAWGGNLKPVKIKNNFNLLNSMVLPKEETAKHLGPHYDRLLICIKEAWKSWEKLGELAPDCKKPLDSTSRANFIWNHIKDNVKKRFKKVSGVVIREKGRLFALEVNGVALLRFKKVDAKHRASNIPTRQQLDLQMHFRKTQTVLAGFPDESTWLTCGYALDQLETKMTDFVITCFVGGVLEYVIPFGSRNVVADVFQPSGRTARTAKVSPISAPQEVKKNKQQ